jgi:hypothetical protein
VIVGALVALLALLVGCSEPPATDGAARPKAECIRVPEDGDNPCQRMFGLVQSAFPVEVASASRILVVDTCPPEAECDRQFNYDALVAIVPAGGGGSNALVVHVFGPPNEPLDVRPWSGPLPDHVAALIAQRD